MHVRHPSRVFVVVLRLCCNQACFPWLSVHRSVVYTRQQMLLPRPLMLALHLIQFAVGGSREISGSSDDEGSFGESVWYTHTPSAATPNALCLPVLF
jgi:hypothetical protein